MTNAVANRSAGAVAALANLKRGIQNTRQAIPASSTKPILRMGTDGIWVYGQDNIEVEDGSEWAVNPLSIRHGFVCWTNKKKGEGKNELLGEVYASMSSDPIDPSTLPDKGWPWKAATSVELKCVTEGEDEDEEVIYKPSSVGGANAMQELLDAIEKQLDSGSDAICPVIKLNCDHYNNKQYGKTYVPIFEVVDWMTMDGVTVDGDGDNGGDAEVEQPKEETKTATRSRSDKTDKKPVDDLTRAATKEELDAIAEVQNGDDSGDAGEAEQQTEGRTRRRRRAA
jgi:hypothetical protein